MKVHLHPLNSCGMRNVQVQAYRDFIASQGHALAARAEEADLVLVWTCAFRKDVRDNSMAQIIAYQKQVRVPVVVAGCLPDIDRERLTREFPGRIIPWRNDAPELEALFGRSRNYATIPPVLFRKRLYEDERVFRRENPDADVPYIGRYHQIYVAEGCPWHCTYCSERPAFPPFKSYPEEKILDAVRQAAACGGRKSVVLLADSVGDYGTDTGSSLPRLIRRMRELVPGILVALQGLNPHHFLRFLDDLTGFIREGFIAHLQIPFQSASDRILRMMERPYTREDLERVFSTLGGLGFREVDSHIIAGFPGETDEEFRASVEFAIRHRIKYLLVSGFMASPQAPATRFPGAIPEQVINERLDHAARRLTEAGILVNTDSGSLAASRFSKINRE